MCVCGGGQIADSKQGIFQATSRTGTGVPREPSPPGVSGPPEQGQHQSAQASGELIGSSGTNQRARLCTGEGGPRLQSGPS